MQSVDVYSSRSTLAVEGTDAVLFLVDESISAPPRIADEVKNSEVMVRGQLPSSSWVVTV
jgi:hypothetical protein